MSETRSTSAGIPVASGRGGRQLHHRVNGRTLLQIAKDPDVKRLIRSLRTTQLIESAMKGGSVGPSKTSLQPQVL